MKKGRVPIGLWAAVVLLPVLVGVIVYSLLPAGAAATVGAGQRLRDKRSTSSHVAVYGSHQIANVWDLEDGCGGQ